MKYSTFVKKKYSVSLKGTNINFLLEHANLKMAVEKLREDIVEINSQFQEEINDIDNES